MAAKTNLGKAYVQIVPSADGITGSITEVLGGESNRAGNSAGKRIVSTIKNAIIAGGIGAAISKSMNLGAELQQNLGGTEAVYGEFAKNIQSAAQEAYKNMGMSASDYMATANKMGSLFQGSGLEQQKALELTTQAMQRAADVASVMGVDASMAMESIAGAAKGNFTMMDNLGVAMNATTIQAYALEKGINFQWNTASNAEKAEIAMQMFMERTSQYAGNYAKEAEKTFSGSFEAMRSAASNVLANLALGEDITPSLTALGSTVKNFLVGNLMPYISNIVGQLPSIFVALIAQLGEAMPEVLEKGFEVIAVFASGIIENTPALLDVVGNVLVKLVMTIVSHLPHILKKGGEIISSLISGILSNVPTLLSKIGGIILEVGREFMNYDWLGLGWNIISGITQGFLNGIGNLVSAAWEAASSAFNAVVRFFDVRSPSHKMEYIGKMNDEGLAVGHLKNIGVVENSAQKLMEAVSKPFDTTATLSVASIIPVGGSSESASILDILKAILLILDDDERSTSVFIEALRAAGLRVSLDGKTISDNTAKNITKQQNDEMRFAGVF